MEIVKTIEDVREKVRAAKAAGRRVGFVPTMGYLHEGHLSLVRRSAEESDYQVMSIFVNPMQFNNPQDLDSYPIDLDRDYALAEETGVDLVFVPDVGEMYGERKAYVDIETLADHLCGSARPGHFRGVLTVVAKLFNIVQPDVAVFGQKDIQQAVSLEKMVDDLNFPLTMIIAPTIREDSGLAMSSRNKRLTDDERERAVVISRSLKKAEEMLKKGERSWKAIRSEMESIIESGKPDSIDYISAVDYHDLQPLETFSGRAVIAVAAFYGAARLIDNMVIDLRGGEVTCSY